MTQNKRTQFVTNCSNVVYSMDGAPTCGAVPLEGVLSGSSKECEVPMLVAGQNGM